MNKRKFYKILSLFLTVMLFSGIVISCDTSIDNTGNNDDVNDVAENQNAQANSEDEADNRVSYDVPELDCGGYVFKSLVRDHFMGKYWVTADAYAEEETGEPFNDTVYHRNKLLENKFNINIQEIRQEDVASYAQRIIRAGSDDFDVLYPTMHGAAVMLQRGEIVNLYDVPHLNFDMTWWNKWINDSMTIGNKLYCAAGDTAFMTNDATVVILFNKKLNEDFGLANPYQLV